MIIFARTFVFTATPMAPVEEPAARLAGYGQKCRLLSESHRSGSDPVDEELGGIRSSD
jgi:hypothetical protein